MKAATGLRLDSWKAIADYLGRNVRTVTRWAQERGMPIHHVPGGKRGAVFAFSTEIDEWLLHQNGAGLGVQAADNGLPSDSNRAASSASSDKTPKIHSRRRSVFWQSKSWRIAGVASVMILAAAVISITLHPMRRQGLRLASVQYGEDKLEGQDADGHTVWVHTYRKPLARNYLLTAAVMGEGFRIADFFGDGNREVAAVVPLRSGPNPNDLDEPEMDFFTNSGTLLWTYVPDRTFRFGDHELKAPWEIEDLLVTRDGGRSTIWTTAAHHTWGNAFIAQLDPRTGRDALRFVNTGTIRRLNELKTARGTYLLAGGFNNEWDSGILAIFNEDRVFAASPQTPGTRHECTSCPGGAPDYYFVFPRTEINQVIRAYEDPVTEIRLSEEGIEISKHESGVTGKELSLYLLQGEPPFSVISLRYNSDYDILHRAWSGGGKLTHSLESCPERTHPQPVRLWTPSGGWTDIPVRPAGVNQ